MTIEEAGGRFGASGGLTSKRGRCGASGGIQVLHLKGAGSPKRPRQPLRRKWWDSSENPCRGGGPMLPRGAGAALVVGLN